MGDRRWSTRFRPVMGKAITLLANVLSGSLLDELFAEKCVEEHHYDELVVGLERESKAETARKLYRILRCKPKPSFATFCDVLLKINGGAGCDLYLCLNPHFQKSALRKASFRTKLPSSRKRGGRCGKSLRQGIRRRSTTVTVLDRDDVSPSDETVSDETVFVDVTKELKDWYLLHQDSFVEALKGYLQEALLKRVRIKHQFPPTVIKRNNELKVAEKVKISIMLPNIDRRRFEQEEKDFIQYIARIMKIRKCDIELCVEDGSCMVTITVSGGAFINLMHHLGDCGILSVLHKIDAGVLISFGTFPWAPIGRLMPDVLFQIRDRVQESHRRAEYNRHVASLIFGEILDAIFLPKLHVMKLKCSQASDQIEIVRCAIKETNSKGNRFEDSLLQKAKQNAALIQKTIANLRACESKFLCWLATKGFWQSYYQWLKSDIIFDVNISNQEGKTALKLACRAEPHSFSATSHILNVLQHLVIKKGVNINQVDVNGMTPLMHACNSLRPSFAVVQQMIYLGANVAARDYMNRNALHFAATKDSSVIPLLRSKMARLSGGAFGQRTPPLSKLFRDILERYPEGGQILKELIQNADDAGATEVQFLLDARPNAYGRDSVINAEMKQFQGPALYAQNNAVMF